IVLQLFGSYFKIGATSLSFVLVPIVLAALLYGPISGGIIGFAFGVIVLIQGLSGVDTFTLLMLQEQPVWTVLLCLVKGTAAGVVPGFVYQWISKKNKWVGVIVASALAPIMNTGLFILGALCFLQDAIMSNPTITGFSGDSILYYLIIGVAGVNFLVELGINLLLSPMIHRVVGIIGKQLGLRKNVVAQPKVADESTEGTPSATEASPAEEEQK
ncbi:MAG: ECF transporter S component, partial [Clostridia bacterium]|nr:ECF transporter S component [Clostridia bacterium]